MRVKNAPKASNTGVVLFVIATLLFFMAYIHRVIPTVIAPDLLKDFSVSASVLGFMMSGYFYGYAFSQPVIGVLADRIGPRKVLAIFAVIATLGILVAAFSTSPAWMFTGRLLIGVGAGGDWVPGLKIISHFFKPRRQGLLAGIMSAGGLSGGIVGTAPYAVLVEVLAWRNSFLLLAVITLSVGILALVLTRSSGKEKTGTQTELPAHADDPGTSYNESFLLSLKTCLKMPIFWYIALTLFFMGAVLMTFQGLWGVPFLMDVYALSRVSASTIIMIVAIGFVVSSLLFGYLVDKYKSMQGNLLIMGYLLVTCCFALFFFFPDKLPLPLVALLCFLIGLGMGTLICIFKITPRIFRPNIYATSWGFLNIFSFLGTLIYQPLSGFIMDTYGITGIHYAIGGYKLIFAFLSVSIFIAAIIAILIRRYTMRMDLI